MLAGDGGDELFGGNERYVSMTVFDRWDRVPAPLRGLIRFGAHAFPFGSKVGIVRKARNYIAKANLPMPDRIYAYSLLPTLGCGKRVRARVPGQGRPRRSARDVARRLPRRGREQRSQSPARASITRSPSPTTIS